MFLKKVKMTEWKTLTENEPEQTILDNAIKYRTCPKSYYDKLLDKSKPEKTKEMGERLCSLTNVPTDRPLGLNDITPFENLLDVNVISSKQGNKFVKVGANTDLPNLFVYLVESDNVQHYHGIASITGFFGQSYFCEMCMKAYNTKEHHSCESTCEVCGNQDCTTKNPLSCRNCHRECRSPECYERHIRRKVTKKGNYRHNAKCCTDVKLAKR